MNNMKNYVLILLTTLCWISCSDPEKIPFQDSGHGKPKEIGQQQQVNTSIVIRLSEKGKVIPYKGKEPGETTTIDNDQSRTINTIKVDSLKIVSEKAGAEITVVNPFLLKNLNVDISSNEGQSGCSNQQSIEILNKLNKKISIITSSIRDVTISEIILDDGVPIVGSKPE